MDIELRHLRYFVAVAEDLHFGRAAQKLGIAQPPLSIQIQRLEDRLGCRLLERRPRVALTKAGAAFLTVATRTLNSARSGVETAREVAAGTAGTISIGLVSSALVTALPQLIAGFRQQFPKVKVRLAELSSPDQVKALKEGEIDMGFIRHPPAGEAGIEYRPAFSDGWVAALPPRHRLAGAPFLELPALRSDPFILLAGTGPGLFDEIQDRFERASVRPQIVLKASDWVAIIGCIQAGLGVSIVPASFARLRWGAVSYVPLSEDDQADPTAIYLGHLTGRIRPAASNFIRNFDAWSNGSKNAPALSSAARCRRALH